MPKFVITRVKRVRKEVQKVLEKRDSEFTDSDLSATKDMEKVFRIYKIRKFISKSTSVVDEAHRKVFTISKVKSGQILENSGVAQKVQISANSQVSLGYEF